MKLYDILRRGAANTPENIAVTHDQQQISFRELLLAVEKVGQALEKSGIPAGSRAAMLYENSIEYVILFFAALRAGLVVVPLDTSLKPDKLQYIIDDCGAQALFVQTRFTRFLPQLIGDDSPVSLIMSDKPVKFESDNISRQDIQTLLGQQIDTSFERLISNIDAIAPREKMFHDRLPDCPHELTAIFYTSGSTGTPKGVMLSHLNLISNTVATIEYLRLTAVDSVIVILPFYYIYGNSLLLTHILSAGRLVLDNRFMYPQVILETIVNEKVTGLSGVPSNFMILLGYANFSSAALPDLRYVTQAGGAMAPDVVRRVIAALSGKEIFIMYGQTEAAPRVSYLPPPRLDEKLGSIGIPVPGVTITICDDLGLEVLPGEAGEITVSGDNVMMGYWNAPDEQKEVLRNGRLFTGDLAYKDKDDFFFIVGRRKEIIKVGGNRVSAKEIEETLLAHPKISEAAALGVPDDILGEALKVVIALRPGETADAREIQDFCRVKLPPHKVPKHVSFTAELPKYQSGKVNKQALRVG